MSPLESLTTWFKTIVCDDVTIPLSRLCVTQQYHCQNWRSLEMRFTVGYIIFWRNKIIHSLPCITVFVVTSGAICQWFSRVTALVKIIGKSPHSWPQKLLYMVTHALFSISIVSPEFAEQEKSCYLGNHRLNCYPGWWCFISTKKN